MLTSVFERSVTERGAERACAEIEVFGCAHEGGRSEADGWRAGGSDAWVMTWGQTMSLRLAGGQTKSRNGPQVGLVGGVEIAICDSDV